MVEFHDARIADELAAFVDSVRARYPAADASAASGPARGPRAPVSHT
jgi:hypothetical protein